MKLSKLWEREKKNYGNWVAENVEERKKIVACRNCKGEKKKIMEVTISATPLTIAFFFSFFFPQFRQATVLVFIYLFIFSLLHFQHLNFHNSPSQKKKKKKLPQFFFLFLQFWQATILFFYFFLPSILGNSIAIILFFFPLPHNFGNSIALLFFFPLRYNFSNSIATHNSYFSLSFLGTPPG